MAYQVLDLRGITRVSGLNPEQSTPAERLEAACNRQKRDRGMELVAIDSSVEADPIYVFVHETDRA